MGNTMTVTAFCIFLMNCLIMGLPMAIHTGWQIPMFGMALGAGKGGMFCRPGLQQLICLIMTTGTDFLGLISRIGDPQRRMHRVAAQAVRGVEHRHGTVVLVAFRANGDTAMFL